MEQDAHGTVSEKLSAPADAVVVEGVEEELAVVEEGDDFPSRHHP